jgi:UDP-2,4-diacetamido-2,4,6-trideoxy-beta-L-altropyranose hydrolase
MRVVFRVDASVRIGSGHVMRCLTLAASLSRTGAQCHFICRDLSGHLVELVRQRGFEVSLLATEDNGTAKPSAADDTGTGDPAYAFWLGCHWHVDAHQTRPILDALQPDWLVVDHYALDSRWENAVRQAQTKILVIDDLADRPHACDVLLDQNLGRQASHYRDLVPAHCKLLVSPEYALLRPEFALLREPSLQRQRSSLRKILVNMGGVDQPNATGEVLKALQHCALPENCSISVVMGQQSPWVREIQALADNMPWLTEVVVNVKDMGQRMAESDLAIGAAGSTSWERCCLGLPTFIVVLAPNQAQGAAALANAQAALLLGSVADIATRLPLAMREMVDGERLSQLSNAGRSITDGRGADRVLRAMERE